MLLTPSALLRVPFYAKWPHKPNLSSMRNMWRLYLMSQLFGMFTPHKDTEVTGPFCLPHVFVSSWPMETQ